MARVNDFLDWFCSNTISDLEQEAQRFQEVVSKTDGWASCGKLLVLNQAVSYLEDGEQYLEIGSYCGRSIAGTLLGNNAQAQVIDPFELFLPDGLSIYSRWHKAITDFGVADRVKLHKTLSANFHEQLPPIGVAYFDGDHDSGHTYESLKQFEPYLADKAIVICDDYFLFGGYHQKPFPGHQVVVQHPVQVDVERWLLETPSATLICLLPWEQSSALIRYERK
jgi:predicted O-methyltransferase YrrM